MGREAEPEEREKGVEGEGSRGLSELMNQL